MINELSALNNSYVAEITKEEFVQASSHIFIPFLIILFIISYFSFLIIGLILAPKSRGKVFTIWFTSFVIGILGLLFLIYLPNVVYGWVDNIYLLFK